ncbi:MAG: CHAT domain-containing protein [Chlorobi bacterium]|nr:CHAT domain-containing protein [Chlorobiota bacterium]
MKHLKKTFPVILIIIISINFTGFSSNFYQNWKDLKKLTKSKTVNSVKNKSKQLINKTEKNLTPGFKNTYGISSQYINAKYEKLWKETLIKFSQSYNVTDFNYAVSYGDNSTPYESKNNIKQAKSFAYYLADPTNTKEMPPKVKGQNYNYTGEILYASSNYKSSEKFFFKAHNLYKKYRLTDSAFAVLTESNLGLLYHTTGRYALAKEYTLKALQKRKKSKNKTGYAASLNNISVLYKDMGLYTDAEDYIIQAEKYLIKTHKDNTIKFAVVENNRAMIYMMTGKYKDAEDLMKKALNIADKEVREKSASYIRMKVNLALLYQLTKRYPEAEKIYLDAIKVQKRRMGAKHPDYAVLLENTASLYQQTGRYDKVESLLKEAVKIFKNKFGTEHPSYAKAIYELALFYQSQNRISEAEPLYKEAFTIQQKKLGKHHPALTETEEHLAILYWQKGDLAEAAKIYHKALNEYIYQINTFFPAMNEYEKTKFWETIHPKFIRYYNFAIDAYKEIPEVKGMLYDFQIATKGLLLNASRKVKNQILHSGNRGLINEFNKWQDTKNYLAKLYTYTDDELKENNINIDSVENVVLYLEKDLNKKSASFKHSGSTKPVNYKQIAATLKPDEAALEIIRLNRYNYLIPDDNKIIYIALILKNNKKLPEVAVNNAGIKMETDYVKEYHTSIHSGKEMSNFYTYYWKYINPFISDSHRIYASVDGIYNQVNLNTIQLPSGDYLFDNKDIRFVTNTKDLLNKKHNINSKKAFLVGFPDYQLNLPDNLAQLPPLPGTLKEVEMIKALLKKNYWQVNEYTKKSAKEEVIKHVNNPYILHLATHGYFIEEKSVTADDTRSFGIEQMRAYENPLLRSGLLFAGADKTILDLNTTDNKDKDDGILNAFEAMVLNLDKTELVVLSACQTGLGEIKNGEGVYGLQRSFQMAGAASVITSLWEVSDEGTQDLMSAFYKYWLQSGNKHNAFRKARAEIKEKYKYPFYWGAFVLVGD